MPLTAFDHVNIRTVDLREMVDWYVAILGLTEGERPAFGIPGAWLYLGDRAVLHLIEADPAPMVHDADESLRLEHFAFRATGMADFLAHLDAREEPYRLFPFEALGLVLVFLRDPDGNRIHIDFDASEAPG